MIVKRAKSLDDFAFIDMDDDDDELPGDSQFIDSDEDEDEDEEEEVVQNPKQRGRKKVN